MMSAIQFMLICHADFLALTAVSWPCKVLAIGGSGVTVYGNSQHCLCSISVNQKLSLIFKKGKQKLA